MTLLLDGATFTQEDEILGQKLRGEGPSAFGIFGRPGGMVAERVLHSLSGPGNTAAPRTIYLSGGLTPTRRLRERLGQELAEHGKGVDADSSWSELIRVAARPPSNPLVLDRAHLIAEADARFVTELERGWRRATTAGDAPRLAIISDDRRFLNQLRGKKSPFYDALGALTDGTPETVTTIEVRPLPYGAIARHCPGWSAYDVIRGFAVFGGMPQVLNAIEPQKSLRWNVVHLLLDPSGPLFDLPVRVIAARFQKAGRYASVLSALADGACTWQEVALATPDFGSGSQMGAYMKRLEERGLIEVATSLDAPPGSRRKRYRTSDPFDSFWFRFVGPLVDRLRSGRTNPADAWSEYVEPHLDGFVGRILPWVARQYLGRYASARLGASTRIVGGLWGEEYNFDAAATLADGSIVYGHCTWVDRGLGVGALERTREELRRTRYGFGRERRTVLLVMKEPPAPELELAALRDPNVEWADAQRLVAAARLAPTP